MSSDQIKLVSYTLRNQVDRAGPVAVISVGRAPDGKFIRGIAALGFTGKGKERFSFVDGRRISEARALTALRSQRSSLPLGRDLRGSYRKAGLAVLTEFMRNVLMRAMRAGGFSLAARDIVTQTGACVNHVIHTLKASDDARRELGLPCYRSEFGAVLTPREISLLDNPRTPAHCVRLADVQDRGPHNASAAAVEYANPA